MKDQSQSKIPAIWELRAFCRVANWMNDIGDPATIDAAKNLLRILLRNKQESLHRQMDKIKVELENIN